MNSVWRYVVLLNTTTANSALAGHCVETRASRPYSVLRMVWCGGYWANVSRLFFPVIQNHQITIYL